MQGMIDSLYRPLGRLGFTDPLHPAIVHVPIGLVIGAFALFAVALIFKRKQLVVTARHLSILALVFAFPSIIFGVFDWLYFFHGAMLPAIKIKMVLAGALLVLLGIGIIIGGEAKAYRATMTAVYAASLALVVALGWFGAGLVYGRALVAVPASRIGVSEAASAPSPRAATGLSEKDAEGKAVFESSCSTCHPGGANIVEPKLPIKGSTKLASLVVFRGFIRSPTMPDGKAGAMPAFDAAIIADDRVAELYSYCEDEYK
jgi:uncharacterized membrane protein